MTDNELKSLVANMSIEKKELSDAQKETDALLN